MKFTDIVAFSILTFTVATAVAVAQPAPGGIARTAPGPMMGDVSVPFEWLISRITVEQAEAEHTPPRLKPFGLQNAKWEALKSRMRPGDELWTYQSPPDSWKAMHGRMGIALVRNGKVIDSILTAMN
jgi:hypothetical protein